MPPPSPASRPRPVSSSFLRHGRLALAVLLLVGAVVVGRSAPGEPETSWAEPTTFSKDPAHCNERQRERQWAVFTVPEPPSDQPFPAPITFGQVARKHGIAPAVLCEANAVEPGCDATPLDPGREVLLPLSEKSADLALVRSRAEGRGTDGRRPGSRDGGGSR